MSSGLLVSSFISNGMRERNLNKNVCDDISFFYGKPLCTLMCYNVTVWCMCVCLLTVYLKGCYIMLLCFPLTKGEFMYLHLDTLKADFF